MLPASSKNRVFQYPLKSA